MRSVAFQYIVVDPVIHCVMSGFIFDFRNPLLKKTDAFFGPTFSSSCNISHHKRKTLLHLIQDSNIIFCIRGPCEPKLIKSWLEESVVVLCPLLFSLSDLISIIPWLLHTEDLQFYYNRGHFLYIQGHIVNSILMFYYVL